MLQAQPKTRQYSASPACLAAVSAAALAALSRSRCSNSAEPHEVAVVHQSPVASYQESRDHHSGDSSAYQEAADHHDDDSSAFQGAADHHDDDSDHDEAISFRALMIDLCTNLDASSYGTLG